MAKSLLELAAAALRDKELTPGIRGILLRLEAGEATWEEVNDLAAYVGRITGRNLAGELEGLGKLEREELKLRLKLIVPDWLGRDYELISEAGARMMQTVYQRSGVGLKAKRAGKNPQRINGLIEELCGVEDYSAFSDRLVQQVENYSYHLVGSTIRANAAVSSAAGLHPKIVRRAEGGCCPWCTALAGSYDYEDVRDTGNDVFRRHTNCNCVVEYQVGQMARNVWTKQQYRTDPEAKAERVQRAALYGRMKK